MSTVPLRTVVIEDERLARDELTRTLRRMPGIEVVGEAASVADATRMMRELAPDLAFLDVQLIGGCGFDALSDAPAGLRTIVVSAHQDHALQAFEKNATDYLLKPVDPQRLRLAVDKVRASRIAGAGEPAGTGPLGYDDAVFLALGEETHAFVPVHTILAVVAEGDYTRVETGTGGVHRVPRSLKHWESRLPGCAFVRIHRSAIVNVRRVQRVDTWFNRRYRVVVDGLSRPLMMSRRYALALKERFG